VLLKELDFEFRMEAVVNSFAILRTKLERLALGIETIS
jgi:hypothetical protein